MSEWVWSHDGERFNGGPEDSKEAAYAQAAQEGARFVGEKVDYQSFADTTLAETLLENEGEAAYERCGEVADDWPPRVCREDVIAASAKVAMIMRELVGSPHFWTVAHVEELSVPCVPKQPTT